MFLSNVQIYIYIKNTSVYHKNVVLRILLVSNEHRLKLYCNVYVNGAYIHILDVILTCLCIFSFLIISAILGVEINLKK